MKASPRTIQFEVELGPDETLSLPEEVAASIRGGVWIVTVEPKSEWSGERFRDHSSFLAGYAPEDEGLYDDVLTG
jgi:hypothetical protein